MINESFRFHVVHRRKKKPAKQSAGKPYACFSFYVWLLKIPNTFQQGTLNYLKLLKG